MPAPYRTNSPTIPPETARAIRRLESGVSGLQASVKDINSRMVVTVPVSGSKPVSNGSNALTGNQAYSLFQSQVASSQWQSWNPVLSASGMTFSSIVVNTAQFLSAFGAVLVRLSVSFTLGGGTTRLIDVSTPSLVADGSSSLATWIDEPGGVGQVAGFCQSSVVSGGLVVYKYDGSNWANGTLRKIFVSGITILV